MNRDPLAAFADIAPPGTAGVHDAPADHYPGSKKKRRAVTGETGDPWDRKPYVELTVKGVPRRLYSLGVLAEALNRKPPAIRKWERLGYIPESRYRFPGRGQHGQRRLYTREQIEGLVKIATEEGVLGESNRNVSATDFPARAATLFKEMK